MAVYTSPPVVERFWAKVVKSGACWEWTASKALKGYGQFVPIEGDRWLSHRFSWLISCGAFRPSLCVCHHCDNPGCVNPSHLFLGTRADNNRDMRMKGRAVVPGLSGESHGSAKLSLGDVRNIRLDSRPSLDIAREYGVHYNTIRNIIRGDRWGRAV